MCSASARGRVDRRAEEADAVHLARGSGVPGVRRADLLELRRGAVEDRRGHGDDDRGARRKTDRDILGRDRGTDGADPEDVQVPPRPVVQPDVEVQHSAYLVGPHGDPRRRDRRRQQLLDARDTRGLGQSQADRARDRETALRRPSVQVGTGDPQDVVLGGRIQRPRVVATDHEGDVGPAGPHPRRSQRRSPSSARIPGPSSPRTTITSPGVDGFTTTVVDRTPRQAFSLNCSGESVPASSAVARISGSNGGGSDRSRAVQPAPARTTTAAAAASRRRWRCSHGVMPADSSRSPQVAPSRPSSRSSTGVSSARARSMTSPRSSRSSRPSPGELAPTRSGYVRGSPCGTPIDLRPSVRSRSRSGPSRGRG